MIVSLRFACLAARFVFLLCIACAVSITVRAQVGASPDLSVDGVVRSLAEKYVLLQTNTNKVLRLRLLAGTEFRGKDGKPFRDSLIHPGDHISVDVNSSDVETAVDVVFLSSGSSSEREAAALPVASTGVVVPESLDFHTRPFVIVPMKLEPPASNTRTSDRPPAAETASPGIEKDLALGRSLLFRNRTESLASLRRATAVCDALSSVYPDCAEAYELYGLAQLDGKKHPDVLRSQVEPLFRKAMAIYENGPSDDALAGSLELEGYILKDLGDEAGSQVLLDRAFPIRARIVESMGPQPGSGAPPNTRPGEGVTPVSVVFKSEPEYSELARMNKISGVVILSIVIEPEGYASNFKLKKGLGLELDEEAVKAVSKWRFRPATKDGKAIRANATIEVNFRLL